ncbi:MAG TPA: NifB/NifX family molybdenum-iron cluster-binding protein [Candidatus Cloacimonas sp.]|jgi:predicted Fe-Mo cluster-binding NifX family protein|nr:NifB/NifX family molybdenum-iron cluster-binding protein [Candidatus Cloacimonas sp.]HNS84467.1 NifB/NifX family molybdenum-iron cluster-binding protein [Candidatus Cloacimonas sp.]HPH72025.1 NifB/NifX family molybdenum-iron cluster-binding protein [Candidatus Cloacimonas sp.]HQE67463.1 NifB/NifX family molybdenum-iron cluster-binding protein [Bacillota bacterium]HQO17960.1 NifB/NifX family molybdenum-iron cluster-binding protein [Candidatus Cloacimonas sp.]
MKIAIPITNNELSSHFGHCESFAIYTVENGIIVKEEKVNPPVHEPGSHPAFLRDLGCSAVITGGMGMKAQQLMQQHGIQVIFGVPHLPLRELINQYLQGKLKTGNNRCEH